MLIMDRKKIFFLLLCSVLFFVGFTGTASASSNVKIYKGELTRYFDSVGNDGDEDYYHVKFDKSKGLLNVKIKLPDRQEIYGSGFYYYHAILAAKKANLHSDVRQVSIKDSDDKYVFNLSDIKALSFSKKDILSHAEQNEPSDYDDAKEQDSTEPVEGDYVEDLLFPKAVYHKSYNDDDDE